MHYADGKLKSRHRLADCQNKGRRRDLCGPSTPVEKGEKIASGIWNERNFDHQLNEEKERQRKREKERGDSEVGRGRGMPTPPHPDSINHNSV